MSLVQRQLALNLRLRDEANLENFLPDFLPPGLLDSLVAQGDPSGEALVFLHGPPDSGKSHLLQALCQAPGSGAGQGRYLPLAELLAYPPDDVLHGVESAPLACLDDVQLAAGSEIWEEALFHLFNRARERGCRLLISADRAPRALPLELPDLGSRLAWGLTFQLAAPRDEQRLAILRFRAGRRGLNLPPEVAGFIVNRSGRSLGELLSVLDTLDQASLEEKRALSVPFVKQAMGW